MKPCFTLLSHQGDPEKLISLSQHFLLIQPAVYLKSTHAAAVMHCGVKLNCCERVSVGGGGVAVVLMHHSSLSFNEEITVWMNLLTLLRLPLCIVYSSFLPWAEPSMSRPSLLRAQADWSCRIVTSKIDLCEFTFEIPVTRLRYKVITFMGFYAGSRSIPSD